MKEGGLFTFFYDGVGLTGYLLDKQCAAKIKKELTSSYFMKIKLLT